MNNDTFDKIVTERTQKIKDILASKAEEYASDTDRLHNFKAGAAMFQCTPERHCAYLMSKHLISIFDMVRDIDMGILASRAQWEEKLGDAINYLILLEALVRERLPAPSTIENMAKAFMELRKAGGGATEG